ncbi:hypothetical protein [Nisaea sp.]|uniref:hypothetical protein n=1 Tax=Nisaea sp. TaxID=2024842 RepID=UPI0032EB7296
MKRTLILPAVIAGGLLVSGCSGMDTTEQRVLSGGAIGAGVGAVGTVLTGGCVTCGAAIGAGIGAGAGYIHDQMQKEDD